MQILLCAGLLQVTGADVQEAVLHPHQHTLSAASMQQGCTSAPLPADSASLPETLLAARTPEEVQAIVSKAFDTASSLEEQLQVPAATGQSGNAASTGEADSVGKLESTAELERYRQQAAQLQDRLLTETTRLSVELQQLNSDNKQLQEQLTAADVVHEQLKVLAAEKEAAQAESQQLLLKLQVVMQEASQHQLLAAQADELQAANAGLISSNQQLQSEIASLQAQVQQLQNHHDSLQQQASTLTALQVEVTDLHRQLADLLWQNRQLRAQLQVSRALNTSAGSGCSSNSSQLSMSAGRSATTATLLRPGPLEVRRCVLQPGITTVTYHIPHHHGIHDVPYCCLLSSASGPVF